MDKGNRKDTDRLYHFSDLVPVETVQSCCFKFCEQIIIDPLDLHRIASFLHISPQEAQQKYCDTAIKQNGIPCLLLANGDSAICPFLQGFQCSLPLQNRPINCAIEPLEFASVEDLNHRCDAGVHFRMKEMFVTEKNAVISAQQWLEKHGVSELELGWFSLWDETEWRLAGALNEAAEELPADDVVNIYNFALEQMYYYEGNAFLEAFPKRVEEVFNMIRRKLGIK